MTRFFFSTGLLIAVAVCGAQAQTSQLIPTSYEAGRFFATPQIAGSKAVRLLVDTGGPSILGLYGISDKAATRLGLSVAPCSVSGTTIIVVRPSHNNPVLPAAKGTPCGAVAQVDSRFGAANWEGDLGAGYLIHFIWTFDYPKKQLWREPDSWKPDVTMHPVAMGLQKNDKGESAGGVPRITVWIGDRPIDMALETGAPTFTIKLQGDARPTYSGSSYMAASTIDQILRDDPGCCSVLINEHKIRTIEIPNIKIAGWRVGPAWFVEMPDANFSRNTPGVGQLVDMPVHGVVGSNVLNHFSMTLDYHAGKAWFNCASGCAAANN
jgi:hypothetical protein